MKVKTSCRTRDIFNPVVINIELTIETESELKDLLKLYDGTCPLPETADCLLVAPNCNHCPHMILSGSINDAVKKGVNHE